MRILVLGGTAFVGRHIVEEALRRGHDVTTFNRGLTAPDHPEVEAIHGDRAVPGDLRQLHRRSWDAVSDTSGFVPKVVGDTASAIGDEVGHYSFVSSLNAYADWPGKAVDEASPVWTCSADSETDDYGPGKAGAERAILAAYGDRALIARAGLIVGPYDNIGRLVWWLRRVARGGDVLAPGDPDLPIQLIDARDLAGWLLDCAEQRVGGVANAVGPTGAVTMGTLLADCRAATGSDAVFRWVADDVLEANGVEPWVELPLWAPGTPQLWQASSARARDLGLRCRPVAETVRDTWAWLQREEPLPPRAGLPAVGLTAEREQELLAASAKGDRR
jgi:2'-hydroxyisoflavone reductase